MKTVKLEKTRVVNDGCQKAPRNWSVFFIVLLGMAMLSISGRAQTAPSPVAGTPNIRIPKPSDMSHWSVRFFSGSEPLKQSEVKPGYAAQILQKEYVITGPFAMRNTQYQDGKSQKVYLVGKYSMRDHPKIDRVMMFELNEEVFQNEDFRKHYAGLEWLKPDHFVEVTDAMGQKCLYFRYLPKYSPADFEDGEVPEAELHEAWISLEGQPIAYRIGKTTGRFTFYPPPTAKIQLPAKYQETLKKYGLSALLK